MYARRQATKDMAHAWMNDEGYSEEDSRTDSKNLQLSRQAPPPATSRIPDFVLQLSETQRTEFAYSLLLSLRTSSVAEVVDRLAPILHKDPSMILPPEITSQILSYLDVNTLLRSTTLSKSWRIRSLDPLLWKDLFIVEGWKVNLAQVWQFEETKRQRDSDKQKAKSRARPVDAVSDIESKSPKKHARRAETDDTDMLTNPSTSWSEQHGLVEADEDEKMEDVNDESGIWTSRDSVPVPPVLDPPARPSLLLQDYKSSRINWQYLYKQKKRLEENWLNNRHTNFQLPHPSHPHEAHAECIYTIQFYGKHLVSGSRDKTLRVWNLDTQRLALPPLRGHDASVLCLQFDSSPENNIIISGGSDCNVIVWQFSTGKLLHKLAKAHREPVLNLRFDDDYLVTCSKDMLIKVWNRHRLRPTDAAYPKRGYGVSAAYPEHIISVDTEELRVGSSVLREYSLLMSLRGHGAAVNAVQVLDGKIVSVSGDRQIKMWDILTGTCTKTIFGHNKGIACVQYDGRRIISGSSDESVRIFDALTGGEVGRLTGHADLVRTVQARFSDIPGSEPEQEEQAQALDRAFFKAELKSVEGRRISRDELASNNGIFNASRVLSYGTKLPPGGGGGRWARIVTGSYDESIIIWTRNSKGEWVKAHQLSQWDAVTRAGGQPRVLPPAQTARERRRAERALAERIVQAQQQQERLRRQQQVLMRRQNQLERGATDQVAQAGASRVLQRRRARDDDAVVSDSPSDSAPSNEAIASSSQPAARASARAETDSPSSSRSTPAREGPAATHEPHAATAAPTAAATAAVAPPNPARNAPVAAGAAAAPQQRRHQRHGHHGHHASASLPVNSRVYKLQFDCRRIICCSQEPTIVGWDYANGDIDIEIASEFFDDDG